MRKLLSQLLFSSLFLLPASTCDAQYYGSYGYGAYTYGAGQFGARTYGYNYGNQRRAPARNSWAYYHQHDYMQPSGWYKIRGNWVYLRSGVVSPERGYQLRKRFR